MNDNESTECGVHDRIQRTANKRGCSEGDKCDGNCALKSPVVTSVSGRSVVLLRYLLDHSSGLEAKLTLVEWVQGRLLVVK